MVLGATVETKSLLSAGVDRPLKDSLGDRPQAEDLNGADEERIGGIEESSPQAAGSPRRKELHADAFRGALLTPELSCYPEVPG